MRRIKFPVNIWCKAHIISFVANHKILEILGEPGYIETDELRTCGGREINWAFEENGMRILIVFQEPYKQAVVCADPPEHERVIAFLRHLGIDALYHKYPIVEQKLSDRYMAVGGVWVFIEKDSIMPTAIFTVKYRADEWIRNGSYTGSLLSYPLNIGKREGNIKYLSSLDETSPNTFSEMDIENVGEKYEYVKGIECAGDERWLLWRQDDNGVKVLVESFTNQISAKEKLQQLESYSHKQTYWIEIKR